MCPCSVKSCRGFQISSRLTVLLTCKSSKICYYVPSYLLNVSHGEFFQILEGEAASPWTLAPAVTMPGHHHSFPDNCLACSAMCSDPGQVRSSCQPSQSIPRAPFLTAITFHGDTAFLPVVPTCSPAGTPCCVPCQVSLAKDRAWITLHSRNVVE